MDKYQQLTDISNTNNTELSEKSKRILFILDNYKKSGENDVYEYRVEVIGHLLYLRSMKTEFVTDAVKNSVLESKSKDDNEKNNYKCLYEKYSRISNIIKEFITELEQMYNDIYDMHNYSCEYMNRLYKK